MTDDVQVIHADCLDALADIAENSVDAIVTDPPYALPGGFMGRSWDRHDGREDAAFAYWLAGLIDGEGHFAIKAHSRGTHAPAFTLKMRADERGTLDIIRRTTGIGSVTVERRDGSNDMAKWSVQNKADCQRLVDLLDKYQLRAKKRLDYDIWREAVCEWTNRGRGNRWHGAASNERMARLRDRIMDVRRYVDPPWSGHEFQDWCRLWATEALRVLKPGGHLLAFGGTRTYHRLTSGIEDAGFEIRDTIAWLYGSGFPKSHDVSKAIDQLHGAEREQVGQKTRPDGTQRPNAGTWSAGMGYMGNPATPEVATAPATDDAARWDGWGTALKPAHEPIVIARKPLTGTVAANVIAHGTGALNINACRIEHASAADLAESQAKNPGRDDLVTSGTYGAGRPQQSVNDAGRWPANVVLDETAADQLDQQTGDRPGSNGIKGTYGGGRSGGIVGEHREREYDFPGYGDHGGASRFFYTAKASAADRGPGNTHPTVKPVELMRWLVRLVTPPDGLIVDPFAGSGTTGVAAVIEGRRAVLIEREGEYIDIIRNRLAQPIQPVLGELT